MKSQYFPHGDSHYNGIIQSIVFECTQNGSLFEFHVVTKLKLTKLDDLLTYKMSWREGGEGERKTKTKWMIARISEWQVGSSEANVKKTYRTVDFLMEQQCCKIIVLHEGLEKVRGNGNPFKYFIYTSKHWPCAAVAAAARAIRCGLLWIKQQ